MGFELHNLHKSVENVGNILSETVIVPNRTSSWLDCIVPITMRVVIIHFHVLLQVDLLLWPHAEWGTKSVEKCQSLAKMLSSLSLRSILTFAMGIIENLSKINIVAISSFAFVVRAHLNLGSHQAPFAQLMAVSVKLWFVVSPQVLLVWQHIVDILAHLWVNKLLPHDLFVWQSSCLG